MVFGREFISKALERYDAAQSSRQASHRMSTELSLLTSEAASSMGTSAVAVSAIVQCVFGMTLFEAGPKASFSFCGSTRVPWQQLREDREMKAKYTYQHSGPNIRTSKLQAFWSLFEETVIKHTYSMVLRTRYSKIILRSWTIRRENNTRQ